MAQASTQQSEARTAAAGLTTETAIGHILFKARSDAAAFVSDISADADDGETYEVQTYQGGRFHVARFFNGQFEGYC